MGVDVWSIAFIVRVVYCLIIPCVCVCVCVRVCVCCVAVGKTSLITRFMYDSFDNTYQVSP